MTKLNEIRTEPVASTSEEAPTARAENRVDSILNEDFQVGLPHSAPASLPTRFASADPDVYFTQLLSLFYLVLGKSRESPATFCMLVTMKRLLTHRQSTAGLPHARTYQSLTSYEPQ